jgi:hypothetical protein
MKAVVFVLHTWPVWLGAWVGEGQGFMLGLVAWAILVTGGRQ